MPRHIACLTFDFDAMCGMIAWGLTSPTPISRGEFGAIGVKRILALLARYGIKATFFIPGIVIGTYPQVCEKIVAEGHEVGHHGWTHVPPAKMTPDQEEAGLVRGCEAIRRLCGQEPAWLSLAGMGFEPRDGGASDPPRLPLREQHDG